MLNLNPICGIGQSWEICAQRIMPQLLMIVQAHTGVAFLTTKNAGEDDLPWCWLVVFFPSSMLLSSGKPPFLLALFQPLV